MKLGYVLANNFCFILPVFYDTYSELINDEKFSNICSVSDFSTSNGSKWYLGPLNTNVYIS